MATEGQHQAQLTVRARVDQAEKSLQKLQKEFTKATAKIDKQAKAQKRASKSLDKFEERMGKASSALGRLTTGFGLAGLAGSIGVGIAALDKMLDRSLRYQNVMSNLPFSIDAAKQSTMGLVDSFTLAQQAVVANRFGVVKNAEAYAKLTEIAAKLAITQGKDVVASIEDITTGIARGSPMILDNLGLTVKLSEANAKWAQANNMAVTEMTAQQKIQALLNEVLSKGEEATKNAKIETEGLAFAWAKAKAQIQGAVDWLTTDGLKDLEKYTTWLRENSLAIDNYIIATNAMEAALARLRAEVQAAGRLIPGNLTPEERKKQAQVAVDAATAQAEERRIKRQIELSKQQTQAVITQAKQQQELRAIRLRGEQRESGAGRGGRGAKDGDTRVEEAREAAEREFEVLKMDLEFEEMIRQNHEDIREKREKEIAERKQKRDQEMHATRMRIINEEIKAEKKRMQIMNQVTTQTVASLGAATFAAIDSQEKFGVALWKEVVGVVQSQARVLTIRGLTNLIIGQSLLMNPFTAAAAPGYIAAGSSMLIGAAALAPLALIGGAATGTGLGGRLAGGGQRGGRAVSRGFGEQTTPVGEQLPSGATQRNQRSPMGGGGGEVYNVQVNTLEPTEEVGVKVAHSIRKARRNGLNTELS